jgi:hypothetical protein
MSGYNEIATCPACDRLVGPATENHKFIVVEGTVSSVHDKRPTEPPSGAVSSDEPYLVLVHENCVDEFVRRVSAKLWPPSN